MKKIFLFIALMPIFSIYSQIENRTHLIGGGNIKLTTNNYELYKDFVVGGESILGFRINKLFVGIGVGAEYTGNNYLSLRDSLGQEIKKVSVTNIDIPMFLDATFGKKFYVEAKLGYSYKLNNISDYKQTNTNTLFNSLGLGYSIAIKENTYIDIAVEGKFNYLFTNTISQNYSSIYFMPIAKIGFRFTKATL